MKKIVIIGAGAMGSAFAVPCADNSNEVFLVGSFLEDKVIGEIKNLDNFHHERIIVWIVITLTYSPKIERRAINSIPN